MKVKDIPELKQKVLNVLPIKQSELWKLLKIDHRDVSDLVGIMVKEHLIKKTKFDRTFLLESLNGDRKKKKDFSVLISGGKFVPCSGCTEECDPRFCKKLTDWLLEVEDKEKEIKKEEIEVKVKEKEIKKEDIEVKVKDKAKNKKEGKNIEKHILIVEKIKKKPKESIHVGRNIEIPLDK